MLFLGLSIPVQPNDFKNSQRVILIEFCNLILYSEYTRIIFSILFYYYKTQIQCTVTRSKLVQTISPIVLQVKNLSDL